MTYPASWGYNFTKTLHNDIYPTTNPGLNPSLSQPGKVVLITGAGRGIGRSIALRYAEAGVRTLVLLARTGSELDSVEDDIRSINKDTKVRKFAIDATDAAQVASMANAVKAMEGRLDVLVNNAGASCPWVPLADTEPQAWWNTWEVNVKAPYLVLHSFLPLLVETSRALAGPVNVINIVSIGALMVAPTAAGYQASKLAALRLTEFVDKEYGMQGVNAFGVHPGGVKTELTEAVPQIQASLIDTPDLCGGFLVWLTSESRSWLSGRYISSCWDVGELNSKKDEIVKEDKLKVRMIV